MRSYRLWYGEERQTNLLPENPPGIRGYDISGQSLPAKEVGGDYYDFIPLACQRNN